MRGDGASSSERQLLQRARGGDVAAFAELCRPHLRHAFNLALRLSGADAATDLCHDALVQAYGSLHRLRDAAMFRPWLLRFVHDACLLAPETSGDAAGDGPLPAALQRLEPQLRAAFVLRDVLDLTESEAAFVARIAPDGFRQRLGRARDKLRELLRAANVLGDGKGGAGQP